MNSLSLIEQDKRSAAPRSSETGAYGESLAAEFLQKSGYRIVLANFKTPIGRNSKGVQVTGEIDIVALDGETICFIEVKTRRSDAIAEPIANVDLRKQRQITRTARIYRRIFGVYQMPHRFDVVTVVAEKGADPVIELHKSFWTEAKFRKNNWNGEF